MRSESEFHRDETVRKNLLMNPAFLRFKLWSVRIVDRIPGKLILPRGRVLLQCCFGVQHQRDPITARFEIDFIHTLFLEKYVSKHLYQLSSNELLHIDGGRSISKMTTWFPRTPILTEIVGVVSTTSVTQKWRPSHWIVLRNAEGSTDAR